MPSFALTGGAAFQKQDAAVASECANGGPGDVPSGFAPCLYPPEPYPPPDPPVPNPGYKVWPDSYPPPGTVGFDYTKPYDRASLRPVTTGTADWAISPYVGADLQLMAPAIGPIPGRPRPFVRGEIQLLFPPERSLAKEGDAESKITLPGAASELRYAAAQSLVGNGSETTSEFQLLGWGAGAGIAFPFQVRGRWLWVKPSVGWTRFGIDVDGLVAAAIKDDRLPDPGDPRPDPSNPSLPRDLYDLFGSNLREVILSGGESRTYDGVGPGLEIEMDAGHFGPIGVSLFAGGAAYRIFGNRTISFSDRAEFPDPFRPEWRGPYWDDPGIEEPFSLPADTYTAQWRQEIDPWLFRAVVGVRFSWLGN